MMFKVIAGIVIVLAGLAVSVAYFVAVLNGYQMNAWGVFNVALWTFNATSAGFWLAFR